MKKIHLITLLTPLLVFLDSSVRPFARSISGPIDLTETSADNVKNSIMAEDRDFYAEGVALRNSGEWEKALATWLKAKETLAAPSESDPRIGIAFIELAVEHAAAYYEQACDLYDWGFSRADIKKFASEIAAEISRIGPLLREDEYKAWCSDLEKDDSTLNAKIRNFWIEKDPTPTSKINERLIEHWERIDHARRIFKKASNTIYGTDDRGLIYVKYGKPDRRRTLQLGTKMDELQRTSANSLAEDDHTAVLTMPHQQTHAHYTLAVEAFDNQSPDDGATPIGAGGAFFDRMPRLDSNPRQLEVSDLVIGVEPPPDFALERLPFPVVPSRQIHKPDALKVYLEIYHLQLDHSDVGYFNIDFRVVKLERKGKKNRPRRNDRLGV